MKKKLFAFFLIFLISQFKLLAIEPDIFVQSTVNRASKLLSDNISKEQKINELKKIAKDTVDIRGIGFYSLGAARKNLNAEDKQEFIILF